MECDVAIMQPTYLPWAGYFNLMARVKYFIFLDDVEFSKSSWQSRNRINDAGTPRWLSLPIHHRSKQPINETVLRNSVPWKRKHINQLTSVYGRAPYFTDLTDVMGKLEAIQSDMLSDVNIQLITHIAKKLDIDCNFSVSSAVEKRDTRSERLVDLIRSKAGVSYLSPVSAREYIESDRVLKREEIAVYYQKYSSKEYPQFRSKDWLPNLSIVDVIANCGTEFTKDYVKE